MTETKYLGRVAPATIDADDLDTLPAPTGVYLITIESDELQAVCPVTRQPDLYHCRIEYAPLERIVESKSLKLYLNSWRDVGIMCEPLTVALATDLSRVLGCRVEVTLEQQVRGGLTITAKGGLRA